MTGLLGGGHAIYLDAADRHGAQPRLLLRRSRARRAAPRGGAGRSSRCRSARSSSTTRSGPPRAPCPACPPGCDALWRAHGRLPWRRLVEPALRLAREGVPMPPAHAACLEMLAPVLTLRRGRADVRAGRHAAPRRRAARAARARRPRSSRSPTRARRAPTRARSPRSLLALSDERGGAAHPRRPRHVRGRAGASPWRRAWLGRALPHARRTLGRPGGARAPAAPARPTAGRARCSRSSGRSTARRGPETHTTNLVAVDARGQRVRPDHEPRPRLGRLAARARPAPQQHARRDRPALRGPLEPGDADGEHDGAEPRARRRDGLVLAIGAAGGTRLRTALVTVAAGILDEGLEPQEAVDAAARPSRRARVVNAEPGVDEDALARARGGRPHRAPLAGAAPLLRRRQCDRSAGPCGRPPPKRCPARCTPGTLTGIQPT